MPLEHLDELVLNHAESETFVHNMIHPNTDALLRRDEFIRGLSEIELNYSDGEVVAECPSVHIGFIKSVKGVVE